MPSTAHEALVQLFRDRPSLAPELLHSLDIALPEYGDVRSDAADFTRLVPAQFIADLLLSLVKGKPVLAIVLEVQLAKKRWARRHIDIGPGAVLQPIVLGPSVIPAIDDPEAASKGPELAVLSAAAHGGMPTPRVQRGSPTSISTVCLDSDRPSATQTSFVRCGATDPGRPHAIPTVSRVPE